MRQRELGISGISNSQCLTSVDQEMELDFSEELNEVKELTNSTGNSTSSQKFTTDMIQLCPRSTNQLISHFEYSIY